MNGKRLITTAALLQVTLAAAWAAEDGAALYKKRCGGCHGASGI